MTKKKQPTIKISDLNDVITPISDEEATQISGGYSSKRFIPARQNSLFIGSRNPSRDAIQVEFYR